MNFGVQEKKLVKFLVVFVALYVAWMTLYQWVIHPWGKLDTLVINDSSLWSLWLLKAIGYETFLGDNETIRTIGIAGTHGLWIGDPCNGITLFALFTMFLLAYPGPWKHKAWYIPLGVTLIHVMNVVRISALCIITLEHPDWLNFNHTYLFQTLMYGFIFLLWYVWIKRYSTINKNEK